jgi:hypothetical protein
MAINFRRLLLFTLFTAGITFLGKNLYGACPATVPSGITTCYYADYTNGSDSNAGTSESAPLQHFPGMTGCAKNCSALNPSSGQGFILRGGITWPQPRFRGYGTGAAQVQRQL